MLIANRHIFNYIVLIWHSLNINMRMENLLSIQPVRISYRFVRRAIGTFFVESHYINSRS